MSPYQTRPIIFNITLGTPLQTEFPVNIVYNPHKKEGEILRTQSFQIKLEERSSSDAQKFTFIHPAQIVSYAVLRPPPLDPICGDKLGFNPVLIGLHGAGLDADSIQAREMLDDAYGICAWVQFPSGVTPWSANDWREFYGFSCCVAPVLHNSIKTNNIFLMIDMYQRMLTINVDNWGTLDAMVAVAAITDWIEHVNWKGPKVTLDSWIVVGHSNGGAWYLSTHYPDNIIAAAPVSGYS
ncbi:hypothetical protein AWENTII_002586 [Aspergillus wentii]